MAVSYWLASLYLRLLLVCVILQKNDASFQRPMATAVNPSSEQVIDSVEREALGSATEAFTASSDQPSILQPSATASRSVTNREIDQSSPHRVNEVTKERLLALFSWEPKIDFRDISSQLADWVGDSFVERSKANKPEMLLAQETEKTPEEAEAAAEEVIAKWLEEGDEPKEKKDKRPRQAWCDGRSSVCTEYRWGTGQLEHECGTGFGSEANEATFGRYRSGLCTADSRSDDNMLRNSTS